MGVLSDATVGYSLVEILILASSSWAFCIKIIIKAGDTRETIHPSRLTVLIVKVPGRILEAQAKLVNLVGSALQMETQPE